MGSLTTQATNNVISSLALLVNRKQVLLTTEDIYIGPPGAAAAATLPQHLAQWFQVKNSTPHVTLLIEQEYESHGLGPMVKQVLQVHQWIPTENPNIQISTDRQFLRISNKTGDQGIAERILLDDRPLT